jgi:heme a synthase
MSLSAYPDPASSPFRRSIGIWLLLCAAMIVVMALIGAITRLTESGLSITEWKPIRGVIPPLDATQWEEAFAQYRQIPEYQSINQGMSLDEFKFIYFWEWLHRLWGRLIGLVFAVPLLWFWCKRRLPYGWGLKLCGLLALGGAQGFIGWFMVQSGLSERTDVSHYRLAMHLGAAMILYGLCLKAALLFLWPYNAPAPAAAPDQTERAFLVVMGKAALGLLFLTIIWGAFVAGLNAGLAYNTWPDMNGHFAPPELLHLTPFWLNPFENAAAVQFTHRWLAVIAVCFLLTYAWMARNQAQRTGDVRQERIAKALMAMAVLQVGLGIATLLLSVPLALATLHQGGAMVLLGLLVALRHLEGGAS